jgi:ubiquinone/menaquinone biosynthesis C-methylase UbiE
LDEAGSGDPEVGTRFPRDAGDVLLENVYAYKCPAHQRLFRAERAILDRLLKEEMVVLELGCGDGRVTRLLTGKGVRVAAVDLNSDHLVALRGVVKPGERVEIVCADARVLPFPDRAFDVVVFAFTGIDFIYPLEGRRRALKEIDRVLKSGGHFVFSSHNPVGAILSPRGARSVRMWRFRLNYLRSGRFREAYFRDPNGLLLYQAAPRTIIRQVEETTDMRFVSAWSRSGVTRNLFLLWMWSAGPYYVFRKGRGMP